MTRYSSLLGKPVEVVYRLGSIELLAAGLLHADSGDFVFVEQHFDQHGSVKIFHLKIPYQCIVRLRGINPDATSTGG
jgi:hypothetical protein